MEYPYVILIAALYVTTIFLSREEQRSTFVVIFLLGILGSIARSDFGGLPFAVSLTCSVAYFWKHRCDYLVKSLWGLAGAAVGVAVDFLHNFLFSGHFLSGSAMTKALWGKRVGYSAGRPLVLVLTTLTSSERAFGLILILFVLLLIARLGSFAVGRTRHSNRRVQRKVIGIDDRKLLASCGLCAIVLYLLVYGDVPALQPWYTVNLSFLWCWFWGRPVISPDAIA